MSCKNHSNNPLSIERHQQRRRRLLFNEERARHGLDPLPRYPAGYQFNPDDSPSDADALTHQAGLATASKAPEVDRAILRGQTKRDLRLNSNSSTFHPTIVSEPINTNSADMDATTKPRETLVFRLRSFKSESTQGPWPLDKLANNPQIHGGAPRLQYDRVYTEEQLVDATLSVTNMANFLEVATPRFAIELISLMKDKNSPIFRVMNECFKQVNDHAVENNLQHLYKLDNEHAKELSFHLGPTLHQKFEALPKDPNLAEPDPEVVPDSRGRGINAKYFIRDNVQEYHKFFRGGRNHYEHERITESLKTKEERKLVFLKFHNEKEAGRKEVNAIRANSYHTGYREYRLIRKAFDCCARELGGPKAVYESSDDWFTETLEAMDCCKEFCLVIFDKDTDKFMEGMMGAMKKADEWRILHIAEGRSEEQYADFMGEEASHSRFYDCYINVDPDELFDCTDNDDDDEMGGVEEQL